MLPSPDILNEFEHGKFVLSNLAAKRAKQLKEGAPPLVRIDSNHPLTVALAEIAAGKIRPIMPEDKPALEEEIPVIIGEARPAEFAVLLPALDESEAALVSGDVLGAEDHEAEPEAESDEALSLADLVGEEEEEAAAPAAEEETLSLSDIAEEETTLEEEEAE